MNTTPEKILDEILEYLSNLPQHLTYIYEDIEKIMESTSNE